MRRPFVAGNWKMNTTEAEAVALATAVAAATEGMACEVAICVPFPHLASVREALRGSHVGLGAQDVYWEAKGAFTGEVSTAMLADYCRYAIIGHSERRQFFGDTDEWVNRKAKAVLANGMIPILCCGETLEQRDAGETLSWVAGQIAAGWKGVDPADIGRSVIAYEPIWAIGTGRTATPEMAQDAHGFIKSLHAAPVLYGGSVKPENARVLLGQPDVDGALVGGASLDPVSFEAICLAGAEAAAA